MNSQFDMMPHVVCDARLETEQLKAVIAPGVRFNHNETFLAIPQELEAVIAPGRHWNHNETFLTIPEELEAVIAPRTPRMGRNPATGG